MSRAFWRRVLPVAIVLAAVSGCGPPLLFQVETVVHSNGSCARTIWQPEMEMLPPEALKPAWKARWKSIKPVPIPPAFAQDFQASDAQKYFTAQGSFRSPAEIPAHYRLVPAEYPGVGASELVRSYEREDFGFVVEHRWRETLTNIVTPVKFLKARDEFLDRALPILVQGIEQVYGKAFDVQGLKKYVREDGRRFLADASIVYYQVGALHTKEEEAALAFAELAKRYGLDLFDPAGKLVTKEQFDKRLLEFLRHRIALGIRHRDGSRLTESEIQSILRTDGKSPYAKDWEAYEKQVEKEMKCDLKPCLLRMFGLYGFPTTIVTSQIPRFAFSLRLPGELVETNGSINAPDWTSWKFSGDESFPDGYVMKARSLEIDLELQRKTLGKEIIADRFSAESYLEIVGTTGSLRETLREVRRSGNLRKLRDFQPKSMEEAARYGRLRELLELAR
ncbi:MAG: hypothetical protein ACP5XB_01575 [Isosphaeraceae bacterium]